MPSLSNEPDSFMKPASSEPHSNSVPGPRHLPSPSSIVSDLFILIPIGPQVKVSAALWTRNTSPSRHHTTRTKVKPESSSKSNSVRALVFHSIVSGFLILIQLGECESNQCTKGSVCPRTTVLSSPLGKPTTALAERGSHSLSGDRNTRRSFIADVLSRGCLR